MAPSSEQNRIIVKVDELMALCNSLKERLSQAQTTQPYLTDAIVEQKLWAIEELIRQVAG